MRGRAFVKVLLRTAATERDVLRSRRTRSDIAVFHEFHPPPYGGGNQFLLALVGELRRRGLGVELNRLSGGTPACLYNSFNFDFRRLRRFARDGARMVHRVDGPVGVYRGFDDGTDRRIAAINVLADATILQSRYSLDKHAELGLELRNPTVIHNAVDPAIFHPPAAHEAHGRLRVVTTSWSDNPRKGSDVLAWLDEHLDFDEFDLTFAGRTQARLQRTRVVGPLTSEPNPEHSIWMRLCLVKISINDIVNFIGRSGGRPREPGSRAAALRGRSRRGTARSWRFATAQTDDSIREDTSPRLIEAKSGFLAVADLARAYAR